MSIMFERPVPVLLSHVRHRVGAKVKVGDFVWPVSAYKQHAPAIVERLDHIGVLEGVMFADVHAPILHPNLNECKR